MQTGKTTKDLVFKKFINNREENQRQEEKHVHDFTKDDVDSILDFTTQKAINKNSNNSPAKAAAKDYMYYADELQLQNTTTTTTTNTKLTKQYMHSHICIYHIITSHIKPFVMFLLFKDTDTDKDGNNNNNNKNRLTLPLADNIEDAIKKANTLFTSSDSKIDYKGFIEDGEDVYFIMEAHTLSVVTPEVCQWALSTELVNTKKVLNVDIDDSVTHFFLENIKLLFVYNKEGHQYECPTVAYCHKNVESVKEIGLCRAGPAAPYGPYYYFDLEVEKEKEKGGVVRFAVFTGKQLVNPTGEANGIAFSNPTGEADGIAFSTPTASASEADGIAYDSLIINSTLVVKTFEQQVLLSYSE